MQRPIPPKFMAIGYGVLLGGVLALALVLRTANLMNVQHFQGDQGRDYLEVMKWLKDGHWPLLGPGRSVGDYALGPGWFYMLAPALALSGFHPAAGAVTVALAAVLTIGSIADWVRRASGSRAAALATAALMAFSARWTEMGRTLWNPHLIPLGVAALAWLMLALPRRPAPGLAATLILMAILPQWHTTGLLVDAAAAPPLAWTLWRAWPVARVTPRRSWRMWGLALAAGMLLLYAPPVVYELQPGPGNLATYFSHSMVPAAPYPGTPAARALAAGDRLLEGAAGQLFPGPGVVRTPAQRRGLGGLFALALAALFVRYRRRSAAPAVGYLMMLVAGFWLVLFRKGTAVQDYWLLAPQTAILMLGGWLAGRCLAASGPSRLGRRLAQGAGAAILLLAAAGGLGQLPAAWRIHQGETPDGFAFRLTRQTAEAIARDSGGRPFSLDLAEQNNFASHYFYLLRWLGRPPGNDCDFDHLIYRDEMGEQIYVVADPRFSPVPRWPGLAGAALPPLRVHQRAIQRIDARRVPAAVKAIQVRFVLDSGQAADLPWEIKGLQ